MAQGMRAGKVAEWQERLARFERSGTTITQFCLDEGISTPSFFVSWCRLRGQPGSAVPSQRESFCVSGRPKETSAGRLKGDQLDLGDRGRSSGRFVSHKPQEERARVEPTGYG